MAHYDTDRIKNARYAGYQAYKQGRSISSNEYHRLSESNYFQNLIEAFEFGWNGARNGMTMHQIFMERRE